MLDEKMGNFGTEKAKKHGFDWQQGYGGGGGGLVKASKGKWGKMGMAGMYSNGRTPQEEEGTPLDPPPPPPPLPMFEADSQDFASAPVLYCTSQSPTRERVCVWEGGVWGRGGVALATSGSPGRGRPVWPPHRAAPHGRAGSDGLAGVWSPSGHTERRYRPLCLYPGTGADLTAGAYRPTPASPPPPAPLPARGPSEGLALRGPASDPVTPVPCAAYRVKCHASVKKKEYTKM